MTSLRLPAQLRAVRPGHFERRNAELKQPGLSAKMNSCEQLAS